LTFGDVYLLEESLYILKSFGSALKYAKQAADKSFDVQYLTGTAGGGDFAYK
jgi:hypothetical protein